MPVYTTRKATAKGKAVTLARRTARVRKYAGTEAVTRSARAKVIR